MPALNLVVTARAPLMFSERRPDGQFRPSSPFVPGTVLRGALAQELLNRDEGPDGDAFWSLFVSEDAPLFRNAYPALGLVPATAFTCKAEGTKHGVWDGLIDRFCAESLVPSLPYLPRCRYKKQGHDEEHGERVEALSGYYDPEPEIEIAVPPPSRLMTRVALNRARRVAEPNLLYSPVAISEVYPAKRDAEPGSERPTQFYGSIAGSEAALDLVRHWLPCLTHVGSGISRGLGRVDVEPAESPKDDLEDRLARFDTELRARWAQWAPASGTKRDLKGSYFSILLMADALLRVDGWTPDVLLSPELLGEAGQGAVLVRSYAAMEHRGGWNSAWGLPKDTEPAVRAGGVYLYQVPNDTDLSGRLEALRALEKSGVGERRQEGFGQVRVCDPFHVKMIQRGEEAER